jgi:hypothetical protein
VDTPLHEVFKALSELNILNVVLPTASLELLTLFRMLLVPVLSILSDEALHRDPASHVLSIGKAWCLIGCLRLHLLLPALPIDPAAQPAVKHRLLSNLTTQLRCNLKVEVLNRALRQSSALVPEEEKEEEEEDSLASKAAVLDEVKENMKKQRLKAIERPLKAADFAEVYSHLVGGVRDLVGVKRIVDLVARIDSPIARRSVEALVEVVREELALQESLHAFAQRLRQGGFEEYEDITSPIASGIGNVSSGLRVMIGMC